MWDEATSFAKQANDLKGQFQAVVGSRLISGMVSFRAELTAPGGSSTGGGVQGVQHLMLIPEDGSESLVVGSANRPLNTVKLRDFNTLRQISLRRPTGGSEIKLEEEAYKRFLERAVSFFQSLGMEISAEVMTFEATPPARTKSQALERTKSNSNLTPARARTPMPMPALGPTAHISTTAGTGHVGTSPRSPLPMAPMSVPQSTSWPISTYVLAMACGAVIFAIGFFTGYYVGHH